MARKMEICPPSECGPKCLLLGIIAAIIAAGGLWLVIGGVMKQWVGMPWTNVLLWYTGGLLLWCIAKMAKMKACPLCR